MGDMSSNSIFKPSDLASKGGYRHPRQDRKNWSVKKQLAFGMVLALAWHQLAFAQDVPLSSNSPLSKKGNLGQTPGSTIQYANLFSEADRDSIVNFWAQPGRLIVKPWAQDGMFQVRETVAGSLWLMKYLHAIKASLIPTVDSLQSSAPGSHQGWRAWVKNKLAYDRFLAAETCSQFNAAINHSDPMKVFPTVEPPGPCPPGLATAAGDPPALAEAVPISTYEVNFGDFDVKYHDHVQVRPDYPYYRFSSGVDFEGLAARKVDPNEYAKLLKIAGVDPATGKIVMAVSGQEGGFDAINTYDTGFVSVGLIQFASLKEGAGSLGELLLDFKQRDPFDFNKDFHQYGIDVQPDCSLDVLDPSTGVELVGPYANAEIINDKRLIAVFQRAGTLSDQFRAEQIAMAVRMFDPINDVCTFQLNGEPVQVRVGDIIHSEAGIATLMDRKVNTGKDWGLGKVLTDVATEHQVQDPSQLAQYESEIILKMKYRQNYLNDTALSQPSDSVELTSRHQGRGGRKPPHHHR